METERARRGQMIQHVAEGENSSSSAALSSPPGSPDALLLADARTHNQQSASANGRISQNRDSFGVASPSSATTPATTASSAKNKASATTTAAGTVPKKPGRKKKEVDPASAPDDKPKARRTRKPKDPAAPAAVGRPRKKPKTEPVQDEPLQVQPVAVPAAAPASRQQKITDLVTPTAQAPAPAPAPPQPYPYIQVTHNQEALHNNPNLSHVTTPSTPRPASSGQHFDPIRSATVEVNVPRNPSSVPPSPAPLMVNRASASPSISSLIDPPSHSGNPISNLSGPQSVKIVHQPSVTSAPQSPAAVMTRQNPFSAPPNSNLVPSTLTNGSSATPMEIDRAPSPYPVPPNKRLESNGSVGPSSTAPTPPAKPTRNKEPPPPLPAGSGLLSGTPFGITSAPSNDVKSFGTNIYLTIPLKGQTNVTINFAQEVQKKYGFAALHPRLAARKERQRAMAAAGAALEKQLHGTGADDDMSLDVSENESNVEMGGMEEDGSTGTGQDKPKKRRMRRPEDYDRDDDFIDDTEMAWEQQALMAKDGFFVYSGPLVTEEKPVVERADGTVKRGRGRGRGGSTRGETSGRGRGRGGGPGSRGGTTVRKPRVTKADRALMEQEKLAREKMAFDMATKTQGHGTVA